MNTFIDLLMKQTELNKDKVAIVSDGRCLSYVQLIKEVLKRAKYLKIKGLLPNSIVAVVSDDSLESLINNISVIFAGGVFLPIDEQIPNEQLKHICSDSKLEFIITNSKFNCKDKNIFISNEINFNCSEVDYLIEENFCFERKSSDIMYVLYTSGSTGLSKGVMIQDKCFTAFRNSINKIVGYDKFDVRFLASTSFVFDISILETLVTLSYGATCVVINKKQKINPKIVREVIIHNDVNVIQFTPTYLQFIMDYFNEDLSFFNQLKKILIGGEVFRQDALKKLVNATNADIYNCYGPTEATIWATAKKINIDEKITLGHPLELYQVYIEKTDYGDEENTGEICIIGEAVAKGYLNRDSLTKEKFFINIDGQRAYRTGDVGKINENGEIEFLCRIDRQVKIKGFRVELDEIENAIERSLNEISRTVVILIKKGEKEHLICHYQSDHTVDRGYIVTKLKEYLPNYMIPIIYIWKKKLPVMINGKIDYANLKAESYNVLKKKK